MTDTPSELLAIDAVLEDPAIFQLITALPIKQSDSVQIRRVVAAARSCQEAFRLYIEAIKAKKMEVPGYVYVTPAQQSRKVGMVGGASWEMSAKEYKTFEVKMHSLRNILARDLKPESATQDAVWFKFTT